MRSGSAVLALVFAVARGQQDVAAAQDAVALWRWAAAQGADVGTVFAAVGATGRGVFLRDPPVPTERVLFRLPRRLCLSVAAAGDEVLRAAVGAEAWTRASARFAHFELASQMDVLALKVASELLLGEQSFWHPYLAAIARPATPQYDVAEALLGAARRGAAHEGSGAEPAPDPAWPARQVQAIARSRATRAVFRASRCASQALDDAALESVEWASLVGDVLKALHPDANARRDAALLAAGVVRARAVALPGGDSTALVPIWDMVNHAANGRTVDATLRQSGDFFEYVAAAGTAGEVVHDYNAQFGCVLDWVLAFGFAPQQLVDAALRGEPSDGGAPSDGDRGSCAEVALDGRTYQLPRDEAELRSSHVSLTLRAALAARLAELPTDAALRTAVDADAGSSGRIAAIVMLHERIALRRTAARLGGRRESIDSL